MLKQPVSVKFYTNVSIVRIKIGKSRFEIACYKNKIQEWRQKVETNINEVLQVDKIFKNVIKGDLAKSKDLENVFPKMTHEEIVKLILDKGEIQVGDKERTNTLLNLKNDIANIIVEKTYNTETGLPFPQGIIIQVLDDIAFQFKENKDAKKQALDAIKLIQEKKILPLERKLMQIFISIKNCQMFTEEKDYELFLTKFRDFLNEKNCQILEINTENPKVFKVKCNILPNHYREILTKWEEVLSIEIISYTQIIKIEESKAKPTEEIVDTSSAKEESRSSGFNMRISNQAVDKFLDENYPAEKSSNNQPTKKPIYCTKCKGSVFYEQENLRKHFKTNWHKYNAKLSASGKESLSAEEYDEYVLMHPEAIDN